MSHSSIIVNGANQHNLKNVSVTIPKYQLVVVTGVSGSRKSSLVYDTLYAESQRQLLETLNSFQRQRIPTPPAPEVDSIQNLQAAVTIRQHRLGGGWRSVVGTATGVYDLIRVLFSRCGIPKLNYSSFFSFNHPDGMCDKCSGLGKTLDVDIDQLLDRSKSLHDGAVLFPEFKIGGWFSRQIDGCDLFDCDKPLREWDEASLNKLLYSPKTKIEDHALNRLWNVTWEGIVLGIRRRHLGKGDNIDEDGPRAKFFKITACEQCHGSRLNARARQVKMGDKLISELVNMELRDLKEFFTGLHGGQDQDEASKQILNRLIDRLSHLISLGIDYLHLDRQTNTLSGGESQRIKISKQLDCNLDLLYCLDEPSQSLHPCEVDALIDVLKGLRDRGNSVICVEHDPKFIAAADHVIELGEGAGPNGGKLLFTGTVAQLLEADTPTARALKAPIDRSVRKRRVPTEFWSLPRSSLHNLQHVEATIPKHVLTVFTGVAGSGKTSLGVEVFAKNANGAVIIDQSAVGRGKRSNVATYIGVFDAIRSVFAKANDKKPGLFSFNSDGACPKCKGNGEIQIEMSFLEAISIKCEDCLGKRYTSDVLALKHKGRNISEILDMSVDQALTHFNGNRSIIRQLKSLEDVGLGYLTLGQSLPSLSGGEAQRVKLASELSKSGAIYVLDEPTSGLASSDVAVLLDVLERLVKAGNSVVVIEHNVQIMVAADWIIDMGPLGGKKGGTIVAEGPPEAIAACKASRTGEYLREVGIVPQRLQSTFFDGITFTVFLAGAKRPLEEGESSKAKKSRK